MRNPHVKRQPKNKVVKPKKGKGAPYDRKKLKDKQIKTQPEDDPSDGK